MFSGFVVRRKGRGGGVFVECYSGMDGKKESTLYRKSLILDRIRIQKDARKESSKRMVQGLILGKGM